MKKQFNVYLRRLRMDDARVSWRWRNIPVVWKNTGSAPDCHVTEEMEMTWVAKALADTHVKRYAICMAEDDRYIGNAYLSIMPQHTVEEQLFIGEPDLWGKGLGTQARSLLYEIARVELGAEKVVTNIRTRNIASLRSVLKLGFTEVRRDDEWICLEKNIKEIANG